LKQFSQLHILLLVEVLPAEYELPYKDAPAPKFTEPYASTAALTAEPASAATFPATANTI